VAAPAPVTVAMPVVVSMKAWAAPEPSAVVSLNEGAAVGATVGFLLGAGVGRGDGAMVGMAVGREGMEVGREEGIEGMEDGWEVGMDGCEVGTEDGGLEGGEVGIHAKVGPCVGRLEGTLVGSSEVCRMRRGRNVAPFK